MHILTDKQFNALMNQQYKKGYDLGYQAGKEDIVWSKFSPNEIRKILGFDPVKKEDI